MDKKISIKNLREMLIMHPYLSAQELVDFAENVVDIFANTEKTVIKNQGPTVRVNKVGELVVKEYKNINEQAIEEYKQKFLADVEKLKKERESNGKRIER